MTDSVNSPAHYESGPFECINLAEQYSFNVGNMIKYVWRHRMKGHPLEDLRKALWYANRAKERGEAFNRIRWFDGPGGKKFQSRLDPWTLIWIVCIHSKSKTERAFWTALLKDDNDGATVIDAIEQLIKETQEHGAETH